MFTRIVETTARPGKTEELCKVITENVLPILKRQGGFQDEIVLVSNTEPHRLITLSFWNAREDAEHYNRETYPKITEMIRNLCEGEPTVRTFDVETSTAHNIAFGIVSVKVKEAA